MGTNFMSIITADFGSMLCCQASKSSFSSVPPVVRIDTWLTSPPRTLILASTFFTEFFLLSSYAPSPVTLTEVWNLISSAPLTDMVSVTKLLSMEM